MNNNIKFDPITGEPIQNNEPTIDIGQNTNPQAIEQTPETNSNQPIVDEETTISTEPNINHGQTEIASTQDIQAQLQAIPTVGQEQQNFIDNVQATNKEKKEDKKEGINLGFIIILFVVMLVAIYFLFPLLLKYI